MIRALLVLAIILLAPPASAQTVPPVRPAAPVDASCQSWTSAKQGATLPGMQLTLAAVPRQPHAVEGRDLAAHRQMTNQIRDLAAMYDQCSPRTPPDPRMSDPAYRAATQAGREDSERHRAANLAAITAPALAWAEEEDAAIDREAACRAAPQCLTDRAAERAAAQAKAFLDKTTQDTCTLVHQRAAATKDIATEYANPTGVVSLTTLHERGAEIQSIDARLPGMKAQYVKAAHKPFVATVCQ